MPGTEGGWLMPPEKLTSDEIMVLFGSEPVQGEAMVATEGDAVL